MKSYWNHPNEATFSPRGEKLLSCPDKIPVPKEGWEGDDWGEFEILAFEEESRMLSVFYVQPTTRY